MRSLISLILISLCLSCAKKDVQLPQTINKDITDVLDVSPIYMFYNEENDSIEFNRKNMISTTNWLVAIDKRLTLKQILPHLQYLQNKRHGDGMHKNENAKNYFTCHNTDIKNLSFIEFTDIKFEPNTLFNFITPKAKIRAEDQSENKKLSSTTISFWEKESFYLDTKKHSIDSLKYILNRLPKTYPFIETLIFGFNETFTFQDYIKIKSEILDLSLGTISISNNEIIYK